jgi:hypothetical protein
MEAKNFMQDKGIFDYCKNICKGRCCKEIGCQQLDKCDNELCISFTCKEVRKACKLTDAEIKQAIRIKSSTKNKYCKLWNTRNPYKKVME